MANSGTYNHTKVHFAEGSAPSTPDTGEWVVYAKTDGLYYMEDDGTEVGPLAASTSSGDVPEELDYTEITSSASISATSEATANTVVTAGAIAFDGSTVVDIEFYSSTARPDASTGAILTVYLYDGSSSIGTMALMRSQAANNGNQPMGLLRRRLTPSSASHTYSIRASVSTGTGTISAGAGGSGNNMPAFIRIVTVP